MNGSDNDPTMRLWSTANEMTRSFMSLWMNTMGSLAGNWTRTANPFGAQAQSSEQVGLAVEIVGGSATVSVTVEPGVQAAALECPGLQPLDGEGPSITEVSFTAAQGREVAHVRVDVRGARPGRYSGVILEGAAKRPVGGLTVTLAD